MLVQVTFSPAMAISVRLSAAECSNQESVLFTIKKVFYYERKEK